MENNSTFSRYEFGSTDTPYLDTYIDIDFQTPKMVK